jgi:hypothetical protein
MVLTLSMTVLSGLTSRAQLQLSAGESFSQHFTAATASSSPNEGWPWPGPRLDFGIEGSPGATWVVELFESTPEGTLIEAVTNQTHFFSWDTTGTNYFSTLWDDLEGSFRLTCLAGSIQLTNVLVTKCSERRPIEGHWLYVVNSWYWSLERPALSLLPLSATQVELKWPMYSMTADGTRFDHYQIEYSSTPTALVWTPLTNEVRQVWTDFCVTIETTSSPQFFRLRKN